MIEPQLLPHVFIVVLLGDAPEIVNTPLVWPPLLKARMPSVVVDEIVYWYSVPDRILADSVDAAWAVGLESDAPPQKMSAPEELALVLAALRVNARQPKRQTLLPVKFAVMSTSAALLAHGSEAVAPTAR